MKATYIFIYYVKSCRCNASYNPGYTGKAHLCSCFKSFWLVRRHESNKNYKLYGKMSWLLLLGKPKAFLVMKQPPLIPNDLNIFAEKSLTCRNIRVLARDRNVWSRGALLPDHGQRHRRDVLLSQHVDENPGTRRRIQERHRRHVVVDEVPD